MNSPTNTIPNPLGVNVHAPAKWRPEEARGREEWRAFEALLAELPRGTPVRVGLLFHEWAWSKHQGYGFEHVAAKIAAMARAGLPVVWEVTPLPWPGAPGWAPATVWGAVAERDFDELDRRFKTFVGLVREHMAKNGLPERGTKFHLGNEPGSGHPGGNAGLPVGEWWERTGRLYERMIRGTDFGAMTLVLPALSFQDHDAATALLERESAGPILRKLARAKRGGGALGSIHHRLHAPHLPPAAYASEWLRLLGARLAVTREVSGRDAVATEVYLFREDRGVADDRGEILRLLARDLPPGVFLYRVGPGVIDPTAQLPVGAVKATESAVAV